jgi:hypothetical protein
MMPWEKGIVMSVSEEVGRRCPLVYLVGVSRQTDTEGAAHIPRVPTDKLT